MRRTTTLEYIPLLLHTVKTGIAFGNGSSIPNLLRRVFHSQNKNEKNPYIEQV